MADAPEAAVSAVPSGSAGEPTPTTDAHNDLLCAAAPEMLEKLKRVVGWLDGLARRCDEDEARYGKSFPSLADNARANARNWRATATDLVTTILAADPEWVEKWSNGEV